MVPKERFVYWWLYTVIEEDIVIQKQMEVRFGPPVG